MLQIHCLSLLSTRIKIWAGLPYNAFFFKTELTTLDLTDNKLRSLPMNFYMMKKLTTAHCYEKFRKAGLWLHKNPLTTPPQEIWKTDNPDKIYE